MKRDFRAKEKREKETRRRGCSLEEALWGVYILTSVLVSRYMKIIYICQ